MNEININQDYFKTWSRNMAYILGLWFATGCIYNNKIFNITLPVKDKYILKQIAKEIGYEGNLKGYTNQVVELNLDCKIIYNDIKNLCSCFPIVPNEFLSDFIRGYFDGTGNIMNIKKGRINTIFICENEDFKILFSILKKQCGVKGGSYDKRNESLHFGTKDSILIGQYMYKDNPELFLYRKYNKFQKFLKEDIVL